MSLADPFRRQLEKGVTDRPMMFGCKNRRGRGCMLLEPKLSK